MSDDGRPLLREIPYRDPVAAIAAAGPAAALGNEWTLLLDSARLQPPMGRWSFLAQEPFGTVLARDGTVLVDGVSVPLAPPAALRRALRAHAMPTPGPESGLPPFAGGLAGLFGYEFGSALERVAPPPGDDLGLPDLAVGLYDAVAAYDHLRRRAWVVSTGLPARPGRDRRRRAAMRAAALAERLAAASDPPPPPVPASAPVLESDFDRAGYEAAVARVVEYILAGDVFQVNLAQRFRALLPLPLDAFDLYRRLRRTSPAPFAGYLSLPGGAAVVSSSPELFLRLRPGPQGGRVETRPIKGTRPRGTTAAGDSALAAELLASGKDRAENVMIVDLMRNDLSRVCADGSIEVPALCALESYASVHHLVSVVTGRLAPSRDALDLLVACAPGGSITGAPKIRAMQIIAALEPVRRGAYCGSLGYLGFDGSADLSIAIRTAAVRDGVVVFHAGGGIVSDSDPAAEYRETLDKASGMIAALSPDG